MMSASETKRPIKIRMYNVGFGDCFLFYIPNEDGGTNLLLLDFGRHMSSKSGNALSKVAADLEKEAKQNSFDGRPYFDVVVATHRHYDHIAGFDLRVAKSFEAGEVWLPWVENPDDPEALALKQAQFDLATALHGVLEVGDSGYDYIANSFQDFNYHNLSNSGAMENLIGGFAKGARCRYLPFKKRSEATIKTPKLPGAKVHVLGPSHDPEVISSLKPPSGEYYEFVAQELQKEKPPSHLFGPEHRMKQRAHFRKFAHLHEGAALEQLRQRANFDSGMAAKKLEDMINGTSLVLIIEVGNAVLVLGGDAEWGTWSVILDDPEWKALLSRTSVYKVSHHGSYNGTPKRYVEEYMPEDAISLVSLCKMEKWPSIPRKSLLDDLAAGPRQLVRSDEQTRRGGAVVEVTDLYVDVSIPT